MRKALVTSARRSFSGIATKAAVSAMLEKYKFKSAPKRPSTDLNGWFVRQEAPLCQYLRLPAQELTPAIHVKSSSANVEEKYCADDDKVCG